MLRHARRHRRAHPPRHAVRRHHLGRRLRNRHLRRGLRRHHHHHRFRHPGPRRGPLRRPRHLVEEGRRPRRHRLRPPHDRHRSRPTRPRRHGRDGAPRRRGQLQALHGLPRRPHGGRRHHLQGPLADPRERRAHLHARRERQRDRHHGQGGARKGKTAPIYHALTRPTRAEAEAVGRAIALAEIAGAPVYIVHLSCEDALDQVKQARDLGVPAFAETCPQYLLLSIEDSSAPISKAPSTSSRRRCARSRTRTRCGRAQKNDLQVVSTDHCPFCLNDGTRRFWARTISPRSRTAARASRTACSSCMTTASARAAST